MSIRSRATALSIAIASILGLSAPTHSAAQDNNVAVDAAKSQTKFDSKLDEVVVTGSRIKRDASFESPVPMSVLEGSVINDSGFTLLGDALLGMPQALVNSNAQSNTGTLFNAGQSRVDLRALGSTRTLVLVNGRRHLTGDFRAPAVDLNLLPSSMIERVEVISGGASAVYGSEAIAGVVNVTLRNRMDGATLDFQGGISEQGDGEEWKASAGYGVPFAQGRGSFVIGGEWAKVEAIYQVDRDWAYPGIRRNTSVSPQTVIPQSRSNIMPTATFQLATNNSVSVALDRSTLYANSTACRTATVGPLCQDPWLIYTSQYTALQGPSDRRTVRTYLDFKLTDRLTVFGDLSYAQSNGLGILSPVFSNAAGGGIMPITIRGDNAYLNGSSPLAAQLRSAWTTAGRTLVRGTTVSVGKIWEEFGRRDSEIERESVRAVAGARGDFNLWNRAVGWETYAQYSELDGRVIAYNQPNLSRVAQAVDAVQLTPGGQIVCFDPAARAAGCAPWDLINGPSPEAIAWTNASARFDGLASQAIIATSFETAAFELPAGALRTAIGAEYREEKSDHIQDALSASNALFYSAIGRTRGQYHVSEAYIEAVAPLLRDLPAAYRWSIEAAGRIGDYSNVGSVDQWRFQTTWAPIQDVSFRASTAKAVRAPNITEAYGPQSRNFTTAALDPCDQAQIAAIASDPARRARRIANCAAVIPGYNSASFTSNFGPGRPSLPLLQGSNPNLFEESADTVSLGIVVKPRQLDTFSFSLDYWRIKIDNAISTIPINTLLANLCYDAADSPDRDRFCGLIRRDPTGVASGVVGGVAEVVLTSQNVQVIETSGIDMALQYAQDFGAVGLFQFRADVTKTIRWDLQGFAGGPVAHFAGVSTRAIPQYKANGTIAWTQGKISLQWQTRFQDSYAVSEIDPASSRTPFYTGNYFEHDVRGTFHYNDALTLRAGIVNVTDEAPPALPEVGNATGSDSSTFDNRGRWFYLGAKYAFGL